MSQLIEMFLLITRKEAEYHIYNFTASKEERERLTQSSSPEEWKKLMEEYNKKICPIQGNESEVKAWVKSLMKKEGYRLGIWSTGFVPLDDKVVTPDPLDTPFPERLYMLLYKKS